MRPFSLMISTNMFQEMSSLCERYVMSELFEQQVSYFLLTKYELESCTVTTGLNF